MNRKHPYQSMPAESFWSRAVSSVPRDEVDPVQSSPGFIEKGNRIATAGSCFAQHLARRLRLLGYNYYVAERSCSILGDKCGDSHSYSTFSARYGNVYTARQLLQLFQRAVGTINLRNDHWYTRGFYIDPLRPNIQPGGFATLAELRLDRQYHLSCVKEMFEQLDVFIFTLGLTEAWMGRSDGIVYPVCPGVVDGVFDPTEHVFHNFDFDEVVADMSEFISLLRERNSRAKIILTVSPVPLAATATDEHVLVATTYSKSVLRVACGQIAKENEHVYYFPSYEIITGAHARGDYFGSNLRDISEEGVDHVMRVFARHFLCSPSSDGSLKTGKAYRVPSNLSKVEEFVQVECDEAMLDG